jgi:hypothetical protein
VAAAQEQLAELRRQRRQERLEQRLPVRTDAHGRLTYAPSPTPEKTSKQLANSHLGWESATLTEVLRQAQARRQAQAQQQEAESGHWLAKMQPLLEPKPQPTGHKELSLPSTVVVYPDIAMAMLREGLVAAGRIWFLLRHLDVEGRGWLPLADVREKLTGKQAPLRVCGWRQLRNLLAEGEGLFWKRDEAPLAEARVWLRSAARVAATLQIARLNVRPVLIDTGIFLESIGTVRAHFYASFHSGRSKNNPISRQRLVEMANVSRRSLHSYEQIAGVERHHNWAIGAEYSQEAARERAWQQGQGVFELTDHKGKAGTPGARYLAWQLPNSYYGPHQQQTTATRKRINRELVDLFMKGITGNGKQEVGSAGNSQEFASPCFYEHGRAAARAYNRTPQNDIYWQGHSHFRRYRVWHVLPGLETNK